MAKKVQVFEKNEGTKIAFSQKDVKLIFGDDDLAIRCDTRQRDYPVHVDVCADDDGNLILGAGRYYVAQVDIPATKYTEPQPIEPDEAEIAAAAESENGEGGGMQQRFTPAAVIPLEMSDVTLTLWAINGLRK